MVSATGKRARPLLTVEAVFLAARARAPAAALAFARWLAGPEAARVRALDGRQTVAARAAWDDPKIAGDPILAAFRAQLPDTVPMSNRPEMRAVWEPAQRALRRVLRGAAEPAAALAEAERRSSHRASPRRRRRSMAAPTRSASACSRVALASALATVGRSAQAGCRRFARARTAYAYLAPAALGDGGAGVRAASPSARRCRSFTTTARRPGRFVGLANFVDILAVARRTALTEPLSFYFTLAVTVLWTVANVVLHVRIGVGAGAAAARSAAASCAASTACC